MVTPVRRAPRRTAHLMASRLAAMLTEARFAALVASVEALQPGASPLVAHLAGTEQRREAAIALARAIAGPALLIHAHVAFYRQGLRRDGERTARLLALGPGLESAELALRLRELADGVYPVVAVDPERLWQVPVERAIQQRSPRLVVLDTGSLAANGPAADLLAEGLLQRLRRLLPEARVVRLGQFPSPARLPLAGARQPLRLGDALPASTAVRLHEIVDERQRIRALVALVRRHEQRGLILAPSRGKASALASVLRQIGLDAGVYHGGLSVSERAALIGTFQDGRQRLLVATESLFSAPPLPTPALVAFSHLPRGLDQVLRLADLAADREDGVELAIVATADELRLSDAAPQVLPTLTQVRRVWRAVRTAAAGDLLLVGPERLGDLLHGGPSVGPWVEVALGVLEQSGFLERQEDLARGLTITLLQDDVPESLAAVSIPGLRRGVPVPGDVLQLAAKSGLRAGDLQRLLLEAEAAGHISLRLVGRELCYRLVVPAPTGAAVEATLARQAELARRDSADLRAWLREDRCRIQALALRYGCPQPEQCLRCDRCNPAQPGIPGRRRRDAVVALQAIAAVGLELPPGAAARAARAALAQQGRSVDERAAAGLIEALLEMGWLERRPGSMGDLLSVTASGDAALKEA